MKNQNRLGENVHWATADSVAVVGLGESDSDTWKPVTPRRPRGSAAGLLNGGR